MPCLTPGQIEKLARNEYEPDEMAELRAHIEQCDACRAKLDECLANEAHLRELKQDLGSTVPAAAESAVSHEADVQSKIGQHIGSYRVVEVLGQGGMGVVYLAEQDHPRRSVALKLIRPGITKPGLLRRFEHEAEILGRLQHPGIAQIYEAGTADAGSGPQQFFAMERVEGLPLSEYAAVHKLGIRARLELFTTVCAAVEHAHQKGVIHRDLKPGNILVTKDGQPKVLDFGVARATDADIQTTTLQTDIGQLLGTIPYMSPEQAAGDHPDELDTRSDVYALGVVLYELLAGRLPHDLARKLIHEAVRIIREDDPTPLSSVNRVLRGDVETIVAKALEKDKTRRYQSASDLASDIGRYLADEPIIARPASAMYQFRKFAKRNKTLVGSVAALFVVLALGVIGTSIGLARARAARDLALEKQLEAEHQTANVRKVLDFLNNDVLAVADPSITSHLELTMRKAVLDAAAERIQGKFDAQPVVEASIRATLGEAYRSLGEYGLAGPHLEKALKIRTHKLGEQHPDTLTSMDNQALLLAEQGRYAEAESLHFRTLELRRRVLGEKHPDTLTSMNNLALLYCWQGRSDKADPLYVRTLELRRRLLGKEHPHTLKSVLNLAVMYHVQGHYDKAEPLFVRVLEICRRVLREGHPTTLDAANSLAALHKARGCYDLAEQLYTETLKISRRVLGEEHPATLVYANNLSDLYQAQGRYTEAEPLCVATLEGRRRVLGEEHQSTLTSTINLGEVYRRQGLYSKAEPLYIKAVDIGSRELGEEHPVTLAAMHNLGVLYRMQRRYDEAELMYVKVLEIRERLQGEEHPDTLRSMNNLAVLYRRMGRLDEAESLYVKTLESRRRVLGEEHQNTLTSMNNLGVLYRKQGRYDEAEPLCVKTLETCKRVLGEEHPDTLQSLDNLAALRRAQGRRAEAESLYLEALEGRRRVLGAEHRATLQTIESLATLYEEWGRYEGAESARLEAYETIAATLDPTHRKPVKAINALAILYDAWGKPEKAAEWRAKLEQWQAATQPVTQPGTQPSAGPCSAPAARTTTQPEAAESGED